MTAPVKIIIGVDNFFHQLVTHDIFGIKKGKTNAVDLTQNFNRLTQSRLLASRQIHLRDITGNNSGRAKTNCRQKPGSMPE